MPSYHAPEAKFKARGWGGGAQSGGRVAASRAFYQGARRRGAARAACPVVPAPAGPYRAVAVAIQGGTQQEVPPRRRRGEGAATWMALGLLLVASGPGGCTQPPREAEAEAMARALAEARASADPGRGTEARGPREVVVLVPRLPATLAPWRPLDRLADHIARDLVMTGLVRAEPSGYPWAAPAVADVCVGIGPADRAWEATRENEGDPGSDEAADGEGPGTDWNAGASSPGDEARGRSPGPRPRGELPAMGESGPAGAATDPPRRADGKATKRPIQRDGAELPGEGEAGAGGDGRALVTAKGNPAAVAGPAPSSAPGSRPVPGVEEPPGRPAAPAAPRAGIVSSPEQRPADERRPRRDASPLPTPVSQENPEAKPAAADNGLFGALEAAGARPPAIRRIYCHIPAERQFHDGRPLSPADVVASVGAVVDPRAGELRDALGLWHLRGAVAVDGPPAAARAGVWVGSGRDTPADGRWVRVDFSVADPLAFERLSAVSVLPARDVRRTLRPTVGAGPFAVRSMTADRIELVRVERGATDPGVVVLRAVPDGADRLRLLRRHSAHVVWPVAPAHVPDELRRTGTAARFRGYLAVTPAFDLVAYRLDRPTMRDLNVRRALDALIPRAAVAELLGTLVVPGRPPGTDEGAYELDLAAIEAAGPAFHPARFGLPVAPTEEEDLARRQAAAALFEAAGFVADERGVLRRGKEPLRVVLLYDHGARARAVARVVERALEAGGVQVGHATAAFSYLRAEPLAKGAFDLAVVKLSFGRDQDPTPYFYRKGFLNLFGIEDAMIDKWLDAYRAARSPAHRRFAARSIETRLAEVMPFSVLAHPAQVILVDRRLAEPVFRGGLLDLASLTFTAP